MLQASHRALKDAHLKISDVDGFMATGQQGIQYDDLCTAAEYLGIRPTYMDGSMTGGSAFECMLPNAMEALRSGNCETILMTYGSDVLSNRALRLATGITRNGLFAGPGMWDAMWGHSIISSYAMIAARHMHEFGTSLDHLAEVAIATRMHALRNPAATLKKPLTPDEARASPFVADPLRLIDCCLLNDGGGALVITTRERARDLPGKPIFILGAAAAQTHWNTSQMPDFSTTGATIAAPRAFARSGRSIKDIDVLQIYDSFTITVLMMLEGMGFCGRGDGGPFVADGKLRPGGLLPLNTDGGGLANSHPGMRGIFLLIEAVEQLRGTAGGRQVENARTAVACGSGGFMSVIGVTILGADPQ
jgi:acetyl-CoA acetyltransferase